MFWFEKTTHAMYLNLNENQVRTRVKDGNGYIPASSFYVQLGASAKSLQLWTARTPLASALNT